MIVLFMFMVWTLVEAKEYDLTALLKDFKYNTDEYDVQIKLSEGDTLIVNNSSADKGSDKISHIRVLNDSDEILDEIYFDDGYFRDGTYIIKTYEEITGMVPESKVKVSLLFNFESGGATSDVKNYYTLVDENKKEVIYHNTYDAANNNPTTYYENETDILLSEISRDGYKFLGWYTSPTFEENTRVTMISKNEPEVLNLYARWEKIDNIINPNTNSMFYISIGIGFILILGTALVIVYKYKKL